MKSVEHYNRCDTVTGRYFSENLKEGVRENRGSDWLFSSFNDSAPFPANFEIDFLTNVTNKINLNEFLAQKFLKLHNNDNQTIGIQSEYRKIRTRKNSVFGHFSRSDIMTQSFQMITMFYLKIWLPFPQVKKQIPESSDIQ